jgi:hypothetical protein
MSAASAPTSRARGAVPILNAAAGMQAHVAPDERCKFIDAPIEDRRYGFFEWQKLGDGTFAPVIRVYDAHVRLAVAEKIADIGYDTIRRLVIAGFVEGSQPSPGTILVSINSLVAHLQATRDAEFWTPARIQKYRQSLR